MGQMNIHMTPRFERALKRYMKARGIKTKSDAVRRAVEEALNQAVEPPPKVDWKAKIGLANKGPMKPREQWLTEDDLWETNRH